MKTPRTQLMALCAFLVVVLADATLVQAANEDIKELPILLRADEMNYDRELGIVTASGNVEVSQDSRVLLADTISYNQKEDVMTASGNVSLLEPTGDVLFAEYLELTGDMKDGIIDDLRILLSDTSRIAAAGGRRSGGIVLDMRNAVYSPCDLCPEEPTSAPLWQLKAIKVVHDSRTKNIEYFDAWMEVAGFPVAYTPYLSHPDPTVRRRTGLLTPSFGSSSDLGFILRTPYFFDIAPNKDATITPFITGREGGGISGQYRHRFVNGDIDFEGSITEDSEDDLRGHVGSTGRFHVDDTWRLGFDLERSSDDTYLRRYGITGKRTLTSHVFGEGFRRRNYFAASTYAFQGLAVDDDPGQAPLVIPLIDFNHVGEADQYGGRNNLDVNLLALTRTEGTDTRRLSVEAGWQIPYIHSSGAALTLSTSLKGDLYHVNKLTREGQAGSFNGVTGRLIPQGALDLRYPVVQSTDTVSQIIEPVAQFVVSPYGGNSDKIPNEDSFEFEFDDTNLFTTRRFPGLDRVEGGPRFNYGVKWSLFGQKGGSTTALIGQSYRVKADDTFALDSGLEDNFSDIVARVQASPGDHFDFLYRTRLDKDNLEARSNEINWAMGPPSLRFSIDYLFFDGQRNSEFGDREELNFSTSAQLSRHWSTRFSAVRDLADDGGLRALIAAFTYEDECIILSTDLRRTFFQDRDLRPSDSIVLRISFKTLGDVETAVR